MRIVSRVVVSRLIWGLIAVLIAVACRAQPVLDAWSIIEAGKMPLPGKASGPTVEQALRYLNAPYHRPLDKSIEL